MRVYTVDLYDYFKVQRPEGGRGYLTCYLRDVTIEVYPERRYPAMLVIPGGGYGMVSDREGEPIALAYLAKGLNSFVLNYSVAPVRYPYQLTEAVMAMNYIRLNSKELNVNENKVSAVGFSAGGHLCATLGTFSISEEVKSVFESKVNARPDAIVLSYAVITSGDKGHLGSFENLCGEGNFELFKKLDILNLVDENSSPAFICTTYTDNCVPVKNSILLAEAYDRVGVPFSIHVWGRGDHGLAVCDRTVYTCSGGWATYEILEAASKSANKWVAMSVEWLAELGLYIND